MSSFKRLTFQEIRELANKTRVEHSKNDSIPVEIEFIIEHGFGMEIIPVNNLKSELDIEAFVSQDLKSISIDARAYEDDRFQGRSRFTLAHELGHRVLHHEFYSKFEYASEEDWLNKIEGLDIGDLDWYESHANEFAGSILIPSKFLHQEIRELTEEIHELIDQANSAGFADEEIIDRTEDYIGRKICKKFNVSASAIVTRLYREKIDVMML